jgi:AcrR family transcriptional regulator
MKCYRLEQGGKKQRRKEIITAAHKIFSTKSFTTATVKHIATAAQLSQGTLYLYFKSKDDLIAVLFIKLLKQLADKIQRVINMDISAEEKIKKLYAIFIETYDCNLNILVILFLFKIEESRDRLSVNTLQLLQENSTLVHDTIINVIREGIEQKILIDEHPTVLADILWGSYTGVVLKCNLRYLVNDQKDNLRSTLNLAFRVITRGAWFIQL